jgi:outer membrane protein
MRTLRWLAVVAPIAFGTSAAIAQSQNNIVKFAFTYYQPHSRTDGGIHGIGVPPGADAEVVNAATVLLTYERLLTPNVGVELVMGWPPKIKAKATGSVAFLGDVLTARNLSPVLLLNYHFMPNEPLRPYIGIGVNYTRFVDIESTLASDVKMTDSTGLAIQAGVEYRLNKDWELFAAIAKVDVKSKVVAVGANVLTATVDFRPITYTAGVTWRF